MNEGVVITGLGAATSLGTGCGALWGGLLAGRRAAAMRSLPCDAGLEISVPVASMPADDTAPGMAAALAYLADQDCAGHRDLAHTLVACREALEQAGLRSVGDLDNAGMVQAFEAPGTEAVVVNLFKMMSGMAASGRGVVAPSGLSASSRGLGENPGEKSGVYDLLAPSFYRTQPFLHVHLAAKALGLHGYCTSVHNACSSGALAIETAAQRIRSGAESAMIVCGGEAFETAVRLEWFRRLGLYAGAPLMTPFAEPPTGFFVGEGGAAIVLESEASAKRRGAVILARYGGGSFRHQGWKQVLPDVRGMWLREAIRETLRLLTPGFAGIDFVVPHGAGTSLSDRYEASCLEQAAGSALEGAWAATFKPNYGHMLAASGIVDTVAAILAMRHGVVPPLQQGADAARTFPARFAASPTGHDIRVLLKLFTGFTGHDAALLFTAA